MVTLHGFSYSNYYNIVKHVLLYKQIPFEEDLRYGGEAEWLAISPVGKVPALTTEQGGHLSESSVLCDYLEEAYPAIPLYPVDVYARNHIRQIMKVSELYLELPCRRFIPFLFGKASAPEALVTEVRPTVQRGIAALTHLCEFGPYIAGPELTMADIYLRYVLSVVESAGSSKMNWDIVAEVPGLKQWQEMMADSAISRQVDADHAANAEGFFAYLKQHYGL